MPDKCLRKTEMMNHKTLTIILAAVLSLACCTDSNDIEAIQERAGKTAEAYYIS